MATEAFVNNKVTELETSSTPANITYKSPTSANAVLSYTTPGTYYFTFPSNVKQIKVTTVGGGGGGSWGSCARWWCYWGGGGGAVTENVIVKMTGSNKNISIVVGAGGGTISRQDGNGGASYIQYNGVTYAKSNGGYGETRTNYNSYNGYAGGPGGGNGGKCEPRVAPGRGKYGAVYTSQCYGGGGSWGNGASPGRDNIEVGIGGGGICSVGGGGSDRQHGGNGAVFINY